MSKLCKAKYLLLFGIFNLGTYFLIQQYVSHQYDFLTPVDEAIPLMPWTVWLYHTLIPGIIGTMFLLVKARSVFMNVFWASILATVVIHICYLVFPSFYPRPELIGSGLTHALVEFSYSIDNSSNTFPSGHVTFAWLMFWGAFYSEAVKSVMGLRRLYFLWAFGVSLSTLTMKMHYIIDVIGGFALAAFCFFIVKEVSERLSYYKNEKNKSTS